MQPSPVDNYKGLESIRAVPLSLESELINIKNLGNLPFDRTESDDWIRWEDHDTKLNTTGYTPILGGKVSSTSTFSLLKEAWISSHQTQGTEHTFEPYSSATEFPFGDTMFYRLLEVPLSLEAKTVLVEGLEQTSIFQDTAQDKQGPFRSFPSLAEAGELSLLDTTISNENQYISPKPTLQAEAPSPTLSPVTSSSVLSPSPLLKPPMKVALRKSRKRKAVAYNKDDNRKLLSQSRKGHNAIEKRYRTNLNKKIDYLRQGIPSLYRKLSSSSSNMSKSQDDDECNETTEMELSNVRATGQQQKIGKAAVLTRALEYIQDLEKSEVDSREERSRLKVEITRLQLRIMAFENLATSGDVLESITPCHPITEAERAVAARARLSCQMYDRCLTRNA